MTPPGEVYLLWRAKKKEKLFSSTVFWFKEWKKDYLLFVQIVPLIIFVTITAFTFKSWLNKIITFSLS